MSLKNAMAKAESKAPAQLGTMAYGKQLMEQLAPAIAKALPSHLNGDRMSRIVLTEFYKVPKLLNCTRESLVGAILQSSQLGLEIGSGMGQAYLIPFENKRKGTTEATFVVGYQGMIELARRSGQIKDIFANVVRASDHFICKRSLEKDILEHEEVYDANAPITHIYAVARFVNGGYAYECWPVEKVIAHALKHSKQKWEGKLTGTWKDDFEGMGKKTVVRALFKYLPKSPELAKAIETDEQKLVKMDTDELELMPVYEDEPEAIETVENENTTESTKKD